MDEREWSEIPGSFGKYWASPDGRIKSRRGLLAPSMTPKGYLVVGVPTIDSPYNKFVHRLIAVTFLGHRPDGCEVNHKDGNKSNNAAENLEYCTSSENKKHAFRNNLRSPANLDRRGFDSVAGKRVERISMSGEVIGVFGSARDAARQVGVAHQNIVSCCCNKQRSAAGSRWRYASLKQ